MLTDVSGKVIVSKLFEKQPLNNVEINLSDNLAEGIYLLHVVNEVGYTTVVKMVRQ
jgi:hypothetical protein